MRPWYTGKPCEVTKRSHISVYGSTWEATEVFELEQNKTKRQFLAEWIKAVNAYGGFGRWAWDVSFDTSDLRELLAKHADTVVRV